MSNVQLPTDFHWMFEIVQTIDVGLVVIDSEYSIQSWNAFMENHSGRRAASVKGQNLFAVFPELPEQWFRQKVDTVRQLNIRAFTTWEQRPYIVRFRNYYPITSLAVHMYQNTMLYPLANTNGEVEHVAIVIFDVTDVATNKMALQEANGELARLSRTDGLSQLYNRAYWEECLFNEIQRSRRHGHPLSLIMLDVDHFKDINDEYGHTCGDDVIRALGREMQQNIRETDIAGRYGGEEFTLILPETDAEAALVLPSVSVSISKPSESTQRTYPSALLSASASHSFTRTWTANRPLFRLPTRRSTIQRKQAETALRPFKICQTIDEVQGLNQPTQASFPMSHHQANDQLPAPPVMVQTESHTPPAPSNPKSSPEKVLHCNHAADWS